MRQEIRAVYSETTYLHEPAFEIFNGEKETHQESVARAEAILTSLRRSGFVNVQAKIVDGMPWITQAHDPNYIDYLYRATRESAETGKPIYPSVHPYGRGTKTSNSIAERGKYVFDTYTPIDEHTYQVALDSAACAVAAAELVYQGDSAAYALTRPPGHHAEHAMAGGYCYVNNAAVAAEYFLDKGAEKVAIFDVDIHHGNGTQGIFYERSDVFVANIHASPRHLFPFFSGNAGEIGENEGEGYNLNLPLPPGVDDETFHGCVTAVLKDIKDYNPDYLIVSAGFDTHKDDPIGTFKLTTDYYKKLGTTIKDAGIPLLVVQEGGYATSVLGENVVSFLKGVSE